ncbi:MAG: endolytic transglycosylase MltG, partial [Acidobacteriota bacterium]|nr:endolytic transglycosylase MltG [Acidobacteriota bacterium]
VSLISDLDPQATTLEGYLFPDTYDYTANTTREQLIEAMVKRFRKVYTADMQNRAAQLGQSGQSDWTTRQVITLASLIEKEAKVDSERELISSVFHRRLKMKVALACDPTVIYAALVEGKYRGKIYQSDLDRDSPYNTYRRAGLPPGPIASPGRRSIQAALNPAETNYLYFVVDATKSDGSHKFSATSAEHGQAVQALRKQEREQSR